ncbi:hypothetical protein IFM89_018983 [Coptis chinensis]|uniref:Uncharacterized protein n=1 Tax=Coptis chinensis TaxID=261450 RepID=A0A835I631_9MAGN|nr:hypothetical protein IFM89_018983 [Coptis chinensis]
MSRVLRFSFLRSTEEKILFNRVLLWSSFLLLDIDMSLLYSSPCISLTHESIYLILPVMLRPVCRKCIYEKLTNEEADCCLICDTGLGCTPIEKLRADHNLQEVRDKIFPSREGKVTGSEVIPSALLDSRRKERSLSSLGISTPHSNIHLSLPGRRTKAAARKAAALRGSNFSSQDPIERMEGSLDNSPDTLNDTAEDIIQVRKAHMLFFFSSYREPLRCKQISLYISSR